MATEADIVPALVAKVETVTDYKTVLFDKVRQATSEFHDYELPAAQFWDVVQTIEHQMSRMIVTWSISLEIVMRNNGYSAGTTDQLSLFDLRRRTVLALFDPANLGIPGVIQLVYNGNISDLHSQGPNLIARVDFDVTYYDDLTGSC